MPHSRTTLPTAAETNAGLHEISTTVKAKYAVAGGAACVALGHPRQTEDIDIVVPKGQTSSARTDLRGNQSFTIEAKTNHTAFIGKDKSIEPIDVEILTPPALFKYPYTGADDEVVVVNGVRVIHPRINLQAKTGAIFSRPTDQKRKTDASDIIFLVDYLTKMGQPPAIGQYGLTAEFIAAFLQFFPNATEVFKKAGLVQGQSTGSRPGTPTSGSRPTTPTGKTTRPSTPTSTGRATPTKTNSPSGRSSPGR